MNVDSPAQVLADFRSQVTRLLQERDKEWEASRQLVEAKQLTATLKRLIEEAQKPPVFKVSQALDSKNSQGSLQPKPYEPSVYGLASLKARRPSGP